MNKNEFLFSSHTARTYIWIEINLKMRIKISNILCALAHKSIIQIFQINSWEFGFSGASRREDQRRSDGLQHTSSWAPSKREMANERWKSYMWGAPVIDGVNGSNETWATRYRYIHIMLCGYKSPYFTLSQPIHTIRSYFEFTIQKEIIIYLIYFF